MGRGEWYLGTSSRRSIVMVLSISTCGGDADEGK